MKRNYFGILGALCGLITSSKSFSTFLLAEITNGLIHAQVYLLDSDNGYYRSAFVAVVR